MKRGKPLVTEPARENVELTFFRALEQLREYISKLSKTTKTPRIIQKQMDMAELLVLFGRHRQNAQAPGLETEEIRNACVDRLVAYVISNYGLVSCFDDLKPYLEQLSFREVECLLELLGKEGQKVGPS